MTVKINIKNIKKINNMRPVFERIKKKFVHLLEVSQKKTFAEDEMDFGKFSMR